MIIDRITLTYKDLTGTKKECATLRTLFRVSAHTRFRLDIRQTG